MYRYNFFFSSRRRHTRCALVTGVQTCALPIYYNLSFLEPLCVAWLRRLYRRCDALIAPSESFAQVLREQRMNYDIGIWTRGVEREIFHTGRRDAIWRRAHGTEDNNPALDFLGRWVMEKGSDVVATTTQARTTPGLTDKTVECCEDTARAWSERHRRMKRH